MQVRLNENHREVAQRKLARLARSADGAVNRNWLGWFAASAGNLASRASNAARTLIAKPTEPQQQCC
jgi:hypothetical protein